MGVWRSVTIRKIAMTINEVVALSVTFGSRTVRKIEPILGLIIVLSCMCGTLYEVIWARQLTLFFGSPVFAASAILGALAGGLGLGSFCFWGLAEGKKRPLRVYVLLGVGLGIFALIFPTLLDILNAICILIYRGLDAGFYFLSWIRFVLSFIVLLIPSILMGGMLLLLGRCAKERCAGFTVDRLFTIGTLACGRWLCCRWIFPHPVSRSSDFSLLGCGD